jgi:hypothetical protein
VLRKVTTLQHYKEGNGRKKVRKTEKERKKEKTKETTARNIYSLCWIWSSMNLIVPVPAQRKFLPHIDIRHIMMLFDNILLTRKSSLELLTLSVDEKTK